MAIATGYIELVAAADKECADLPSPRVPIQQSMPSQEEGTKVARPLPYQFDIQDSFSSDGKSLTLTMKNIGTAGGYFMYMITLQVMAREWILRKI